MVETDDIQALLQTGSWTTSRAREPRPEANRFENPARVRANQSSKLDPHVPRLFNLALHNKRFPPPPTVEDEAESLAKEHGSITTSGSEEDPKFRGDVEQHPILLPVHEHNPERRFVLLSNVSDDSDTDEDREQGRGKPKPKPDYEANTGRKVAAPPLTPRDDLCGAAKPGLERRKSRQDLPRIATDLPRPGEGPPVEGGRRRAKSNVTINQQGLEVQEPSDYFSRQDAFRQPDDYLSPAVKHGTNGRDRAYWDLNSGSNGGSQRNQPARDDRRGPSTDDKWSSSHSSRSPMSHKRHPSGVEAPKFNRHMSEQGRYHEEVAQSNGRRRESPPPDLRRKQSPPRRGNRKSDSPPQPQSARSSRDSLPSRAPSYRRRARSPVFEQDGYSSDDRKSQHPPRQRRPTISQENRTSMLVPDLGRTPAPSRPRSKATTPVPSPHLAHGEQFPDMEPPRSPRSATFPKDNASRRNDDERPVSPFFPTDVAPRNKTRLDDGERGTRPRAQSRTVSSSIPTTIPIPIPVNLGDCSPVERRRPTVAPPPQSRQSSYEENPSKSNWQLPQFSPTEYKSHLDKPIQSYRRHSEDVQRGLVPRLPECSRKVARPGFDDWLTIARAENFDICPDCYESVFALTDFKHDFILAPARPLDRPLNCDFGSSIWYRIAFLMTLKHGYSDLRLLKNVAASAARYSPCAGARNDTRVWYSIIDPHARRPIPSFTVCHCCARSVEALFPNLAGVFMPLDSASESSRSVCAMHYLPGRKRFDDFVDLFETTSDRAISRKSLPDLQLLADKVREKSLDDECMRSFPVMSQKWHVMESIPHFTVCAECFDVVVWPIIEGEPNTVARNFLQQKQRRQAATCQLYSERMRETFRRACRKNDIEYLEDKVNQRMAALQDIKARNEVLSRQDPQDPKTKEELAQIYKELRQWE